MPDVYRYEWTGPHTGLQYRLDIYPANAAALSSPVIESLTPDTIEELSDWGWAYKKHPYGVASSVQGKVTFKASRVPATLMGWLVDGITSITSTIATGVTVAVETGTVFDLHIKPPGGTTWSRQGVYVQDVKQPVRPKLAEDALEVSVVCALQHAMKSLTWEKIRDADWYNVSTGPDADVYAKTSAVEWVWTAGVRWWYVAQIPVTSESDNETASCFWFYPCNYTFGHWNSYVRAVYRSIVRMVAALDIQTALLASMDVYRQTYTTNPTPGTAVTGNDACFLLFLTNDNAVDPATSMDYSMHDVLHGSYQCFYDMFVDMIEGRYKTWATTFHDLSVTAPYPKGYLYDPLDTGIVGTLVDVTSELRSADPQIRERVAINIVASSEFAIDDDYEESQPSTAPAGRNDDGVTVPVVFDMVPMATDWEQSVASTFIYDRIHNNVDADEGTVYVWSNPRLLGIYYPATPTDGGLGNAFDFNPKMIRAHSWQPFKRDGGTATAPVTMPIALPATIGSNYAAEIKADAIAVQQSQGCVTQLASTYFADFYGRMTTLIEAELGVDVGAEYDLTGIETYLAPFQPHLRLWGIDPSTFRNGAYLSPCPTSYWMVECSADLKAETMKAKFWGNA